MNDDEEYELDMALDAFGVEDVSELTSEQWHSIFGPGDFDD